MIELLPSMEVVAKRTGTVKTGLRGCYELTGLSVDVRVNLTSPGVYVLGRLAPGAPARPWSAGAPAAAGTIGRDLIIRYVGRSDSDVRAEIKKQVGRYDAFQFEFYPSDVAAFDKECRLYHDLGGAEGELDNTRHPLKPERFPRMTCPACGAE
jgi:hypothetical protein